jgi:hypothetical protein
MSFIIVNTTDKPIDLAGVSLPPKKAYTVETLTDAMLQAQAKKALSIVDATLSVKERKELADLFTPNYHTGDPAIDGPKK